MQIHCSSPRRFDSAHLRVGNHDGQEHHEKTEQISEASLNGRFDAHEIGREVAVLQDANDADRGEKNAQRVQLSLNGEQSRRPMIEGGERDGHVLVDVPMPMDVQHDDHDRDHQQTHVDPIPEVKKETPVHASDFRRFNAHEENREDHNDDLAGNTQVAHRVALLKGGLNGRGVSPVSDVTLRSCRLSILYDGKIPPVNGISKMSLIDEKRFTLGL